MRLPNFATQPSVPSSPSVGWLYRKRSRETWQVSASGEFRWDPGQGGGWSHGFRSFKDAEPLRLARITPPLLTPRRRSKGRGLVLPLRRTRERGWAAETHSPWAVRFRQVRFKDFSFWPLAFCLWLLAWFRSSLAFGSVPLLLCHRCFCETKNINNTHH